MSFVQKIIRSRANHLSLLIAPSDNGRIAWFFIRTHPGKERKFKEDATAGGIDIGRYGEVIKRGWGDMPPPAVIDEMKTTYGFEGP